MGKRIISQRRGRGTFTYRAPSHHFKADIQHPSVPEVQSSGMISPQIRFDSSAATLNVKVARDQLRRARS